MRLQQIKGNDATFVVEHDQGEKPRVGDSFYVRETSSREALVVQIMALETTVPEGTEMTSVDRALGKVRRHVLDGDWLTWNGWIPSGEVEVVRIDDRELLSGCGLLRPQRPLHIGATMDGISLAIEGQRFEKVNVITAMKGMGKSHLAKVLILQLIEQGMPCVVFDINREYGRLPGVDVLSASVDFKLAVTDFGLAGLMGLFQHFGATEKLQNEFERRIGEIFAEVEERPSGDRFLTINDIREPFRTGNDTMNSWTRRLIDQIAGLRLFAADATEGEVFRRNYERIEAQGGALVVDLAPPRTTFAREAFVGATLSIIEQRAEGSVKPPFVFFEEAHLYTAREQIENLVTRARHLGVTCTFITNMVTELNEAVLRQVDNLFLLHLPHRGDVRHVSKSAAVDSETVEAFALRIDQHHALLVGAASGSYPLVFKVDDPDGVDMAGITKYAFPDPALTPATLGLSSCRAIATTGANHARGAAEP